MFQVLETGGYIHDIMTLSDFNKSRILNLKFFSVFKKKQFVAQ